VLHIVSTVPLLPPKVDMCHTDELVNYHLSLAIACEFLFLVTLTVGDLIK